MAHGSTQLQTRETPDPRHGWFAALRRGVILGAVSALHLGLLALLFGPVTPRWPSSVERSEHHDALSIRLVAAPAKPRRASSVSRPLMPVRLLPRQTSTLRAIPDATAAPAPAPIIATVAPPVVAGNYHSPLLSGRSGMTLWPTIPRLPGSDVARVQGITFQARSSLKQVVRAMTKGSRCKYTRMKMAGMANQFITAQLTDRALEADGCGPQTPHTADDETVKALSHQAIFGD